MTGKSLGFTLIDKKETHSLMSQSALCTLSYWKSTVRSMKGLRSITVAASIATSSAFAASRMSGPRGMSAAAATSFHDLTDVDTNGVAVDFSQFKGKVAYCVNVASA